MNKEINISGKKIFYRVHGSGNPVVLVHGFGETGDVWKNQAPSNSPEGGGLAPTQTQPNENSITIEKSLLSESSKVPDKFQFIIPDLPGSGQSEMIDDMSMEGMAEVVKIIIDKETDQSAESSEVPPPSAAKGLPTAQPGGFRGAVALIGHSMGGYITLAFAEKYPGYLCSFGLFHSSAFADTEEKKTTRRKGIEFITQHGAFEFLKTSTPNLFSPVSAQRSPELIDQFVQSLNNFSPRALVSYYESMIQRPDRIHVLKNAKVPVLFILGKYDNAVPLQDGLKLCHLPEKSYIHILHESGHMGMLEEADKTNRMLEEFLYGP
jgi:pimeloyl-ACP methyl ester carboxylesterase